jgi:two-component system nitrate/nitrite sensor histidine kinase NarX
MNQVDEKSDSAQDRLSPWRIPPATGWRLKSYALIRRELGRPLLLIVALLAGLGAAILATSEPASLFLLQLLLLIALVGGIGLLLFQVNQRLIEPLAHLRNWAARMRGGNLSAQIPVPARGEFGALARDINRLGAELKSLTREMNAQVRNQTVRLARKTQSLDILYDVSTSLNQSASLDKLLEDFLEILIDLVDARAGSVRLLDGENRHRTRLIASRGLPPETVERDRSMEVDRCQCGWASMDGEIHIQRGTEGCAKLLGRPYLERDCSEFVVIPIQYQARILGVYNLFLDKPVSALGEDAHDLLGSIGKHLGLAIEKARLDNDARRLAIMEERQTLGNELHDSLAQSLVGMRLQVKMLGETLHRKDLRTAQNEVNRLRSAVEDAHASLRELLSNFRFKLDDGGLVPAITNMIERFNEETGISVFFQNECPDLVLSPNQEIQVFRIVQEALANIRKHSEARNARILLNQDTTGRYYVLIEDDGRGLAPTEPGIPGEHLGLDIMRERAASLAGELSIESEPGEGTRILLAFDPRPATRARAQGA